MPILFKTFYNIIISCANDNLVQSGQCTFNVYIQSKLLQHTPVMGTSSGQHQYFRPRQNGSVGEGENRILPPG